MKETSYSLESCNSCEDERAKVLHLSIWHYVLSIGMTPRSSVSHRLNWWPRNRRQRNLRAAWRHQHQHHFLKLSNSESHSQTTSNGDHQHAAVGTFLTLSLNTGLYRHFPPDETLDTVLVDASNRPLRGAVTIRYPRYWSKLITGPRPTETMMKTIKNQLRFTQNTFWFLWMLASFQFLKLKIHNKCQVLVLITLWLKFWTWTWILYRLASNLPGKATCFERKLN